MALAAHIGQVGKYEATGFYIDTLGATFTGARTAQTAVTDGDLADSDEKTITIYSGTTGEPTANVLMWRATWNNSSTRWERVSELGSIGTIADEDDVSVWVVSGVPDVPSSSDSTEYVLKNGAWSAATAGGLTYSAQTVTTGDVTGAVNYHYMCDISGMTASRNITLPTATAGDKFKVSISTGDDTYALIIKGAATVTINGGTAATEATRLLQSQETMEFTATSTTNWQVTMDGRIPCISCCDTEGGSNQTLTDGSYNLIEVTNAYIDSANLHDVTNKDIVPRRSGKYKISATFRILIASPSNSLRMRLYCSLDRTSIFAVVECAPTDIDDERGGYFGKIIDYDIDTDTSIAHGAYTDVSSGTIQAVASRSNALSVQELLQAI